MIIGTLTRDAFNDAKDYNVNGEIITIRNDGTSGFSWVRYPMTLKPDQEVKIDFEYRNTVGDNGRLGLDISDNNNYTDRKTYSDLLTSKEWESKSYTFKVPSNRTGQFSRLSIGLDADVVAEMQIRNLRVNTERFDVSAKPECVAMGVIRKVPNGDVILHYNSPLFGIISAELTDPRTISVKLDMSTDDNLKSRPIPFVTGTTDFRYAPVCGAHAANADGTTTVKVCYVDNSGNFVDLTNENAYFYLMVMV
ncbi:hypothetical protein [Oceanobacillus neutriphilus]|uniref:Uncharacterized protein n=1 Tax=Oceanobacillus neutriphilus TaxID=531815 RepID=A0ABQ2P3K9_9BACI|nr:hypothetical protein [Oceanobacillus neutriphilus]GGP17344.1 hypothetical protein GCM10011346_52750 [Oceanobacillus neutriphilus]